MANLLGNYNPTFFANEALIVLMKSLGFAGRVYRGVDESRAAQGNSKGESVNLKRPSNFTAQTHVAGTGTSSQDLVGQNVQVTLDNHQEVKFQVSDRELAYTSQQIIDDHIAPAAYALADKIDQDLHALGTTVGPKWTLTGSVSSTAITGPRRVLRGNNAPMDSDVHYLVDSGMEAAFLDLGIFHEARIAGDEGKPSLMAGTLGRRFGVEVFATQNADVTVGAMASTATASAATGDLVGAVNGAVAANVASVVVDGFTGVETLEAGDTFTLAGDSTKYILTAGVTLSAGAGTLAFYPALRANAADDAVITFDILTATQEASHLRNLMFHKNAFALAFAPLPMTGDGRGASIDTVTDPSTGLSVRARMYYDGTLATNFVALDVLYGAQVLDGQLAARVVRAPAIAPV